MNKKIEWEKLKEIIDKVSDNNGITYAGDVMEFLLDLGYINEDRIIFEHQAVGPVETTESVAKDSGHI